MPLSLPSLWGRSPRAGRDESAAAPAARKRRGDERPHLRLRLAGAWPWWAGPPDGRGRQGEGRSTPGSPAQVAGSVGRNPVPRWPLSKGRSSPRRTCDGQRRVRSAKASGRRRFSLDCPRRRPGSRPSLGAHRLNAHCAPQALLGADREAESPRSRIRDTNGVPAGRV